jgi:hypothetical protein
MANSFRVDDYQPNVALSYLTIGLFIAMAVVSIGFVGASLLSLGWPEWGFDLEDGEGFIPIGVTVIGLLALLEIPLRLILIIVFLIWLYKAYSNLTPLQGQSLQFSPGWAVGWWFIPFANLVKPFQVVREVYNESDPDFDPDSSFMHVPAGTPFVIGVWWAAFLLSGFAYRISNSLYGDGDLPASSDFAVVLLFGAVFGAGAALLAAYIVRSIFVRQQARIEIVRSSAARIDEPPPPPQFEPSPYTSGLV